MGFYTIIYNRYYLTIALDLQYKHTLRTLIYLPKYHRFRLKKKKKDK